MIAPLHTLLAIQEFIRPLQPPVVAFEKRSRISPFRTLISVMLSSRTQDKTTGAAAERLFSLADNPRQMLALGENKISRLIRPVGFYNQKARHIIGICRSLLASPSFPNDFSSLVSLPGVGRKTANLVLALAFDIPTVAVDTHVFRISRRLGWAKGHSLAAVEEELQKNFPEAHWKAINQALVGFGQTICRPIRPRCRQCFLPPRCPYYRSQP